MQSASSMIWTRIAVSISYDNNHYTTGTSDIRFINAQEKEKQWSIKILSIFVWIYLLNGLNTNILFIWKCLITIISIYI